MSELKPCPFCGHKAILEDLDCNPRFFVKCSNRYCGVEQAPLYMSKASAIKAWNRRKKNDERRSD